MAKKSTGSRKLSKREYLERIARETARMSWPGHMNMVDAGTKEKLETFFVDTFPLEDLWNGKSVAYTDYDRWHKKQTQDMSKHVVENKLKREKKQYCADAVSAKFLNTFMHQLMKYGEFRGLYKYLHLPLDSKVLPLLNKKLNRRDCCAYTMDYVAYAKIQNDLWAVVEDYNKQLEGTGIKLRSRIDLNTILWAGEASGKRSKN